ncbi:MAG TPA: hypothetical protein VGO57_17945 [Verrucomicrobiae bacterium]|jgi:hypothetical protein
MTWYLTFSLCFAAASGLFFKPDTCWREIELCQIFARVKHKSKNLSKIFTLPVVGTDSCNQTDHKIKALRAKSSLPLSSKMNKRYFSNLAIF